MDAMIRKPTYNPWPSYNYMLQQIQMQAAYDRLRMQSFQPKTFNPPAVPSVFDIRGGMRDFFRVSSPPTTDLIAAINSANDNDDKQEDPSGLDYFHSPTDIFIIGKTYYLVEIFPIISTLDFLCIMVTPIG